MWREKTVPYAKYFFYKKRVFPIWKDSLNNSRQRPTLPHSHPCSTISAGKLNFCVRDGNRCDLTAITTFFRLSQCFLSFYLKVISDSLWIYSEIGEILKSKDNWSISITRLNTLLCLHLWPINVVVSNVSHGKSILRLASRLDAFSGYPFRT